MADIEATCLCESLDRVSKALLDSDAFFEEPL
jgi:hypothetical protein